MKLVTAHEMQAIDRAATSEYGIPTLILMENAGRAVAEAVRRHAPRARSVAILAGAGNNGGDGFVAARHLSRHLPVTVFLAAPREKLKGDALLNFRTLQAFPVSVREVCESNLTSELAALGRCDLLVDALFGTGLSGPLSPFHTHLIEGAQAAAIPILAVDIPSGLAADSGVPLGISFHARWTVTMGLPKVGMWAPSAAGFVGEMEVADIGFPPALLADESLPGHLIEPDLLGGILPPRPSQAHKGSSGTVLVLAGSLPYRGAANLAGMAALRSGAGLSRLGLARSLCLLNLDKPDELVQLPLPEEDSPVLAPVALEMALEAAAEARAVVLGPGLGQDPRTAAFVFAFLRSNQTATVLDADGLNIVASNPTILLETPAPLVLTPHPGEMGRLLAVSTQAIQEERINRCL
ncbi:MAG: NAD(P)H-hydrate epimerase, partial [Coprothermobacterota bacterium]|nr:NAD(P)H-hydrate epimerase [Coprothermobacterota bacterium]